MNTVRDITTLSDASGAPADPFTLFRGWFGEAKESEPSDPNAMCLSTLDADGRISSRIVLMKDLDPRGIVFYTNRESRKGRALAAHPLAALNFHWKTLARQIRIEGPVEPVDDAESDAYFATRPRGSRIGAWASAQSRPLPDRATLTAQVASYESRFAGETAIPRPAYWGGYLLRPETVEFWQEGAYRLHARLLYTRQGCAWETALLFP